MKKRCLSLVLAALAIAVADVSTSCAAMVTTLNANGNGVNNNSGIGKVDLDIVWNSTDFVLFQVTLESGDTSPLAFSTNMINISGQEWTDFHVQLEGDVTWSAVNSVSPTPDSVASTTSAVDIFFDPPLPEFTVVILGDPGSPLDPADDWFIDTTGLVAGDTFNIRLYPTTAVVPEPSTFALLGIGGIALVGYGIRRKRRQAA